jgi:hypothetical protein
MPIHIGCKRAMAVVFAACGIGLGTAGCQSTPSDRTMERAMAMDQAPPPATAPAPTVVVAPPPTVIQQYDVIAVPPPPIVEVVPVRPRPAVVWVPGYWVPSPHWVWVRGHWR